MKTLLERAKSRSIIKRPKRDIRKGELELVLAYIRGEIALHQYGHAIGWKDKHNGSMTHRIGSVIRQAVAHGDLKLVLKKKK